jgi:hypothetical protein
MVMNERGTRKRVQRRTVDLSGYPDLVVIYLGMRVNALVGLKRLLGLGPQIQTAAGEKPDGLLLHENLLYGLFPPHLGMRSTATGSLRRGRRPHRREESPRSSTALAARRTSRGGESIRRCRSRSVLTSSAAGARLDVRRPPAAGLGGEALTPVVTEAELYERAPARRVVEALAE